MPFFSPVARLVVSCCRGYRQCIRVLGGLVSLLRPDPCIASHPLPTPTHSSPTPRCPIPSGIRPTFLPPPTPSRRPRCPTPSLLATQRKRPLPADTALPHFRPNLAAWLASRTRAAVRQGAGARSINTHKLHNNTPPRRHAVRPEPQRLGLDGLELHQPRHPQRRHRCHRRRAGRRHPRLLALPRALRQVLAAAPLREKGRVQGQWRQAALLDEARRGR